MKEDTNLREHGLARGQTNHNYIRGVRIWAPRQALSREEEKEKKSRKVFDHPHQRPKISGGGKRTFINGCSVLATVCTKVLSRSSFEERKKKGENFN